MYARSKLFRKAGGLFRYITAARSHWWKVREIGETEHIALADYYFPLSQTIEFVSIKNTNFRFCPNLFRSNLYRTLAYTTLESQDSGRAECVSQVIIVNRQVWLHHAAAAFSSELEHDGEFSDVKLSELLKDIRMRINYPLRASQMKNLSA